MVEYDDLVSAGYVGLLEADKNFDPKRGVKFWTYADHLVNGRMMDVVRSALGRTEGNIRRHINDEDANIEGESGKLEDAINEKIFINNVWENTKYKLSDYEYILMRLRYKEGLPLEKIGEIIGVNESRASQMFSDMEKKLIKYFSQKKIICSNST